MTIQSYSTQAGRINQIKGEMIAHALPVEVLALGATMKKIPKNSGDNVTYRRVLPYGGASTNSSTINRWSVTASAHVASEGVTPAADTITYHDVAVTMQQYIVLYSYTDKAALLYEDDIPEDQKIAVGERTGLVREMIRYGAMKACTNVSYSGGTTRATVDEPVKINFLRNIAITLKANHAKQKTRILAASPDYDTAAIEASYVVFGHTDLEPDIRDLPNFVPVAKYANRQPINEFEIGSCESFRFILSPELAPYLAAGAAIGSTGMYAADNTTLDVYPMLVMGEEAVFDVALRGVETMDLIDLKPSQKDKNDPAGQRGYVGAKFWSAVLVANNGWMAVGEVARTAL